MLLQNLRFDNRSLARLPTVTLANPTKPMSPVPNAVFALAQPTRLASPSIVAISPSVFALLDVDAASVTGPTAAALLCGSQVWPEARPAAHCYCGHQFGYFSGQLGDGATMYIGETVNSRGERWEMQWKGAGLTPFSRQADGRKVYRSSLREFLASEHMFALGIPTTRAASLVVSEEATVRDEFYDGRPRKERCAVVVRVAKTFIRFGSFEIARPIDQHTGMRGPASAAEVRKLFDYVAENFYPDASTPEVFLEHVARRTAALVAQWQAVGFTHGVMNTDNMSIVGDTIDYGPYGFMQTFDPCFVPNFSDDHGRYRYNAQPSIARWNVLKLAESLTLAGILAQGHDAAIAKAFDVAFAEHYDEQFRRKLGLAAANQALVDDLLSVMHQTAADWTNTFFALHHCVPAADARALFERFIAPALGSVADLSAANRPHYELSQVAKLLEIVRTGHGAELLRASGLTEQELEHQIHRHERFSKCKSLSEEQKRAHDAALWIPWLSRYLGLTADSQRDSVMRATNPRFILRNGVAQRAIVDSKEGRQTAPVRNVLALCLAPFAQSDEDEAARFAQVRECLVTDAEGLVCSCSS